MMKTKCSWIPRRALVVAAVVASAALAPAMASAGGPVFSTSTMAHRYNFNFTGHGVENGLTLVGWFDVDGDTGTVTAGTVEAHSYGKVFIAHSMPLSVSTGLRVETMDPDNGIYRITIVFQDGTRTVSLANARLLIDDARGRTGTISGAYSFFTNASIPPTDLGVGVGRGEIASQ